MSADETALFIVDQGNSRIRRLVLTTTRVTTATGSGQTSFRDGPGLTTAFGLAYDAKWRCDSTTTADCGLLVADYGSQAIRFIIPKNETLSNSPSKDVHSMSGLSTNTISASESKSASNSLSASLTARSMVNTRTPSTTFSMSRSIGASPMATISMTPSQ